MKYSHAVIVFSLLYIPYVHCNVLLTLLLINLRVTSQISDAFTHGVSIGCKKGCNIPESYWVPVRQRE